MKKRVKKKILNALNKPKRVTCNRAITLRQWAHRFGYGFRFYRIAKYHAYVDIGFSYCVHDSKLFDKYIELYTDYDQHTKFKHGAHMPPYRYVYCLRSSDRPTKNVIDILVYDRVTKKFRSICKCNYYGEVLIITTITSDIINWNHPEMWKELDLPSGFEFHDDEYADNPKALEYDYNFVVSEISHISFTNTKFIEIGGLNNGDT